MANSVQRKRTAGATRLRQERERRGLSLVAMTGRTAISPSALSLLERRKGVAWPDWRRRISRALRVPEAELFAGEMAR